MRQRFRAMLSDGSGFTLVELLIVMAILGTLCGVVVFAVARFDDRGQAVACKSDRKTVEGTVEAYGAKISAQPNGVDSNARFADNGYLRDTPTASNGYIITISDNDGTVTTARYAPKLWPLVVKQDGDLSVVWQEEICVG